MAGRRTRYGADFKAKVALEAIRGEATISELAIKHGVHQTLISTWSEPLARHGLERRGERRP